MLKRIKWFLRENKVKKIQLQKYVYIKIDSFVVPGVKNGHLAQK